MSSVATSGNVVEITNLTLVGGTQTTTSATATNITDLIFPVLANSTYIIMGGMGVSCNNTGGVKFAVTVPAGATLKVGFNGWSTNKSTFLLQEVIASATLTSLPHCTQASSGEITVMGTVTTGATAGNVQFQFASNTSTQISGILADGTGLTIIKK